MQKKTGHYKQRVYDNGGSVGVGFLLIEGRREECKNQLFAMEWACRQCIRLWSNETNVCVFLLAITWKLQWGYIVAEDDMII